MASLLSLSAELQLSVIEQLNHTSNSFIPAPSTELLNFSRVCKALRNITLPYLFRDVTLLNDEKSGSSVLAIVNQPYVEHVRSLHYIGVVAMTESGVTDNLSETPAPEHLPDSVQDVLSNLAKISSLERVIVEFRCAKTAEEDEDIYRSSYDIAEELEGTEQVLEAEENDAFRALVKRSYDALACNPAGTIQKLEMRNVVAKDSSAWKSHKFHELLGGLTEYSLSLRGGDNGAGWQVNMVPAYLNFIQSLDSRFFQYLDNVKSFRFEATEDGPPGVDGGRNNARLDLGKDNIQSLEILELEQIFISKELAAFIASHGSSLKSVRLNKCYSAAVFEEGALAWGDFFSMIANDATTFALHEFHIGISDLETTQPQDLSKEDYGYDQAVGAKELREQYPGRRMFDYKTLDDKYGMLFDNLDLIFERVEHGRDHAGWEQLRTMLKNASAKRGPPLDVRS